MPSIFDRINGHIMRDPEWYNKDERIERITQDIYTRWRDARAAADHPLLGPRQRAGFASHREVIPFHNGYALECWFGRDPSPHGATFRTAQVEVPYALRDVEALAIIREQVREAWDGIDNPTPKPFNPDEIIVVRDKKTQVVKKAYTVDSKTGVRHELPPFTDWALDVSHGGREGTATIKWQHVRCRVENE